MTGWDFLNNITQAFPPIALVLLLLIALIALIVFIIGFSKHSFKQSSLDASFERRFDELKADINRIETNHFGHLKNYLGILNGVLLDKRIIDNETKARLDNELRGM
ncbi:MAG: hypothetical protein LBG73_01305 [Spirochaetaceae bacterium]|jgi:hypothetical protein|nr:hypothetical protein [Spirochaetaceae bacterium]